MYTLAVREDDSTKCVAVNVDRATLIRIRDAVIQERNQALQVGAFSATAAVGLSHAIAMLGNALDGCNQAELEATLSQ